MSCRVRADGGPSEDDDAEEAKEDLTVGVKENFGPKGVGDNKGNVQTRGLKVFAAGDSVRNVGCRGYYVGQQERKRVIKKHGEARFALGQAHFTKGSP